MSAEELLVLIEGHWEDLQKLLGDHWPDFERCYDQIVDSLPVEPSCEQVETAVDSLCDLMAQWPGGRELLLGVRRPGSERLIADSSEVLRDEERIRQICTRLRNAGRRNQGRPKKSKAGLQERA